MFSSYVVWYLFLAGVGSGSFVVAACCAAYDECARTPSSEALARKSAIGFVVAPILLVLAAIFLLVDLGAPDKAWQIILMPFESVVATGAWSIMLLVVFAAILGLARFLEKSFPRSLEWFCWIVGIALGFVAMAYTGLLLSDMVAIDFWHSWLLPILFVVSSLSTGFAAILGIGFFFEGKNARISEWQMREPMSQDKGYLSREKVLSRGEWRNSKRMRDNSEIHREGVGEGSLRVFSTILAFIEIGLLVAFLLDRFYASDVARQSCDMLLSGEFAPYFWVGVIMCGLVFPLVIRGLDRVIPLRAFTLISSIGVLVGGFCLRFGIANAALYTPIVNPFF